MNRLGVVGLVATMLVAACGGSSGAGLNSGGTAGDDAGGSGGNGGTSGAGGSAAGGSGGSGGSGVCISQDDCQTGVCDEFQGRCVECLFETDCSGEARCVDRRCVAETRCQNSLDCVEAPSGSICDPRTQRCEECVEAVDCDGTADCVNHRCVPFTACRNSLDCDGQVCDPTTKRCVDCVDSADCLDGTSCIANQCRELRPCQSDNQCTPMGQLCDRTRGVCADCLEHADCPTAYHCALGVCALNECAEGASRCVSGGLQSCLEGGVGWGPSVSCGMSAVCVDAGGTASCQALVCQPSETYCDGKERRQCSGDGLSSSLLETCPQFCQAGACSERECEPSTYFCDGQDARLCAADGLSSTWVETCSPAHYCHPETTLCVARVCQPGAPLCSGDVATHCDANGAGPLPGGTNCASSGLSCSEGACVNCPSGAALVQHLVLDEVFTGDGDYFVIQNRHPTCSVPLGGLHVEALTVSAPVTIALPSQTLAPMAKLRVVETGGTMTPGAFQASATISWLGDAAGAALLCSGVPCSALNVIDAMRWQNFDASFPAGVTFTALPSISAAEEDSKSFTRVAYTGSAPSFASSDWAIRDATVPTASSCPPTMPTVGVPCSPVLLQCTYGSTTCTCFPSAWVC